MSVRYDDIETYHQLLLKYPNVTFYGRCSIKRNVEIGEGTRIGEYCVIGEDAQIGKNCRILYHVTICKGAIIGDNVDIGPNTTFCNDKYPPSSISLPPTIEDNVVIGAGCIVYPGVLIGHDSKIGAGVRVIQDVMPNTGWLIEKVEYEILENNQENRLKALGYL